MLKHFLSALAVIAFVFLPAALAGEGVYRPPRLELPEVLAEFPGGKVTAVEFLAAARQALAAADVVGECLRRTARAAAADMGARDGAEPGLYGWGEAVAFSAGGRDFPWQEAVGLYLARIGDPSWRQALLRELLADKILRAEAAGICPETAGSPAPAAELLRRALEPLFTPDALTALYERRKEEFLLLKAVAGKNSAVLYIPAGRLTARLPITAYGIDYLREGGVERSPLTMLPEKNTAELLAGGMTETADYGKITVTDRVLPRQPARALPLLAAVRLAEEKARLLDAVFAQARVYDFNVRQMTEIVPSAVYPKFPATGK